MLEMMAALRRMRAFDIELMFKRDNEVLFILRKIAPIRGDAGHA
jgi:hypothetical protein